MGWRRGDLVVRRMYRASSVIWAQATRVVRDDADGLLLWLPVGAGFADRPNPAGARAPRPVVGLDRQPMVIGAWRAHDVLVLVPPDEPWSVWWFFTDGAFDHWYVNLERPATRWERDGLRGVDSYDHALDVLVAPDRSWSWKDADELDERIDLPGYWDQAGAAAIRADGGRVVQQAERGVGPFDGRFTSSPYVVGPGPELAARAGGVGDAVDPSWPPLALPPQPDWDTPPCWDQG